MVSFQTLRQKRIITTPVLYIFFKKTNKRPFTGVLGVWQCNNIDSAQTFLKTKTKNRQLNPCKSRH